MYYNEVCNYILSDTLSSGTKQL